KEYVDICYSLGSEEGYKLFNAVLQNLSMSLRSEE
ncbi:transcription antitermination protein NusB, partial [Francisella tularensis subsp. holarctica]|nr:transcription antitermination protein NusB [Francisella tularensis subsp. holarctica]